MNTIVRVESWNVALARLSVAIEILTREKANRKRLDILKTDLSKAEELETSYDPLAQPTNYAQLQRLISERHKQISECALRSAQNYEELVNRGTVAEKLKPIDAVAEQLGHL